MKLRKGLEPCPSCGKIVDPTRRRVPHPETKECLVRRTIANYTERGMVNVGAQLADVLQDCGIAYEKAPGSVRTEMEFSETVFDGFYVPESAATAVRALSRLQLPPRLRRFVIPLLITHPDYVLALDTVRRLDGGAVKWLRKLANEHGYTGSQERFENEAGEQIVGGRARGGKKP